MCFLIHLHFAAPISSSASVHLPSLALLSTLSMLLQLKHSASLGGICISHRQLLWFYDAHSISLPVQPCAEPLLHRLKMFDRFIPNGRTQWNYIRALNSAEQASPTLADFSTTAGRWREKAAALVCKLWCSPTRIHISIFCLLPVEEHYIVIVEQTENNLQNQSPESKKKKKIMELCTYLGIQTTHCHSLSVPYKGWSWVPSELERFPDHKRSWPWLVCVIALMWLSSVLIKICYSFCSETSKEISLLRLRRST